MQLDAQVPNARKSTISFEIISYHNYEYGQLSAITIYDQESSKLDTIYGATGSIKIIDHYAISTDRFSLILDSKFVNSHHVQHIEFSRNCDFPQYHDTKIVKLHSWSEAYSHYEKYSSIVIFGKNYRTNFKIENINTVSFIETDPTSLILRKNIMIDLEKSAAIIKNPLTQSLSIRPSRIWSLNTEYH